MFFLGKFYFEIDSNIFGKPITEAAWWMHARCQVNNCARFIFGPTRNIIDYYYHIFPWSNLRSTGIGFTTRGISPDWTVRHWMDGGNYGGLETSRKRLNTWSYRTVHHALRYRSIDDNFITMNFQSSIKLLFSRSRMGRNTLPLERWNNGIYQWFMEYCRFHIQHVLSGLDVFKSYCMVHRPGTYTISNSYNASSSSSKKKKLFHLM